jgi:hypothetical protein
MSDFAKLYKFEGFSQVLCILKDYEEGEPPCIEWMMKPPGLGLCSFAISFSDDDEGVERSQRAFEAMNEQSAYKAALALCEQAGIEPPAQPVQKGEQG